MNECQRTDRIDQDVMNDSKTHNSSTPAPLYTMRVKIKSRLRGLNYLLHDHKHEADGTFLGPCCKMGSGSVLGTSADMLRSFEMIGRRNPLRLCAFRSQERDPNLGKLLVAFLSRTQAMIYSTLLAW